MRLIKNMEKKVTTERFETPESNDGPKEVNIPNYEDLTVEQRRAMFNDIDAHEILIQSWLKRRTSGQ